MREGKKEEYKKRHDKIWTEMKDVLKQAGIKKYSIWITENELFDYYVSEFGVLYAAKNQSESDVVKRLNEYMKDVIEMPVAVETDVHPHLGRVFDFN